AFDMLAVVEAQRRERERLRLPFFEVRFGLHTGPVIAGVVGRRRFTYDVWGDAVNVAALMQANGEPGRINVSEAVHHHVKPYFETAARGTIEVKNKAPIPMYFLERLKPEYSADKSGRTPNERLYAAANLPRGGGG